MKKLMVLLFILFPTILNAVEYHIGPGQTYTSIGAFPWSSTLAAGDIVYIHAKSGQTPYYEKLCIGGQLQGTQANPIKIIGVNDGNGNKPILDGNNATTSTNFNLYGSDPQYHSELGLLFFGPGPSYGTAPAWVEVQNLKVQNTKSVQNTNELSVTKTLTYSAVYLQGGTNITLDGLDITGGADGIFAKDGSSPVENITVKNSYVYNNGVVGDYLYHNIYTEVKYITFENNTFGRPVTGSPGNNVKDRSTGFIFRYNKLEGGAHLLDLVECQDECADHTSDAGWDDIFVYGNTFYTTNGDATQLFHLGTGDGGANTNYWRKNLYFYNNTVVSKFDRSVDYKINLFQISSSGQTVYLNNNIFYTYPVTDGAAIPVVGIQQDNSGTISAAGNFTYGVNWITAGWQESRDGTTVTGTTIGLSNLTSDGSMAFTDLPSNNFHLASGSAAINLGAALPTKITTGNWSGVDLTPVYEPFRVSRESIGDAGAFDYSSSGTPAGIKYSGTTASIGASGTAVSIRQ